MKTSPVCANAGRDLRGQPHTLNGFRPSWFRKVRVMRAADPQLSAPLHRGSKTVDVGQGKSYMARTRRLRDRPVHARRIGTRIEAALCHIRDATISCTLPPQEEASWRAALLRRSAARFRVTI
jgi:hypothetical protein